MTAYSLIVVMGGSPAREVSWGGLRGRGSGSCRERSLEGPDVPLRQG